MMRKLNYFIALFCLLVAGSNLKAQTAFSENFNGGNALSNWTLIDVDGRTADTTVGFVNDAWVVFEDLDSTGIGDSAAVSTSFYSPAGAANDYMISPMIVTGSNPVLEFDAKAQLPAFPDGYEVLISTTTPDVAGLNANPALFTTTAENATWTRRGINLSAYANDTIYLAWRNNSNDQFLLFIDNIRVFDLAPFDASVTNIISPVTGCNLGASDSVEVELTNAGSDTLNLIPLSFRLNGGAVVTDTFVGTLLPGTSVNYQFGNASVNLATNGQYLLEVYTDLVADGDRSNDTLSSVTVNTLTAIPYTEDFDALPPLNTGFFPNGWSVQSSGGFFWVTNDTATGSTATGPNGDHTSGNGIYFYTEASQVAPNSVAALNSPCLDLSAPPLGLEMEFWYHMFGADITTLFIQAEDQGVWTTVDSIVGQQQTASTDPYQSRIVDLSSFVSNNSQLRVRFLTVRGASFNGDVAIDDVRFYEPVVSVEELDADLQKLSIYPNPSNLDFTNLSFDLQKANQVEANIVDMKGRVVSVEDYGTLSSGNHQLRMNTAGLENGIYFVRIQFGENVISRKLSIMK